MAEMKRLGGIPTVSQIVKDRITKVAAEYWAPYTSNHKPFDPKIIAEIYMYELVESKFSTKRVMLLEFSQYLECFLWPNYNFQNSSLEHVLSIVVMVNEKFRERVPAWEIFKERSSEFDGFFRRVLEAALDTKDISYIEQTMILVFLINCVASLEVDLVRSQLQKVISLPAWCCLLQGHRDALFKKSSRLKKYYLVSQKNDVKLNVSELNNLMYERQFVWKLLTKFSRILKSIPIEGEVEPGIISYCERFLELLIDLESLLPTRRFFNAIFDGHHVVTKCVLSNLAKRSDGRLFSQLLDMLKFYAHFEIDDFSGEQLTENNMNDLHYKNITSLQKAAFKNFRSDLNEFCMLNVASVDTSLAIKKFFGNVKDENLYKIAEFLNLVPSLNDETAKDYKDLSKNFLIELFVRHFSIEYSEKPND